MTWVKQYDVIAIGTGSAMYVIEGMMQRNPNIKVAVIDKDEPGGICLTRGCIPSKILLYPAEVIRTIETAGVFGIEVDLRKVSFEEVMGRMRSIIDADINSIREGLSSSPNIDYYPAPQHAHRRRGSKACPTALIEKFLSAQEKPGVRRRPNRLGSRCL